MGGQFAGDKWELVANYDGAGEVGPIAAVWRLKVQGGYIVAVVTEMGSISTCFVPDIVYG